MVPQCFYEYYDKRTELFKYNYDLALNYFSVEGIHDLRVEIKRLRAFYRLIEWINPTYRAKKNFKKIRQLFKAAGPVRDIHVLQDLVRMWMQELNINVSEFYNILKHEEMIARKNFYAIGKSFNVNLLSSNRQAIEKYLLIINHDYIFYRLKQRFDGMMNDLIEFKNKDHFNTDDYHKIRIHCKETRYTLDILQKCEPGENHYVQLNNDLRSLHQALGNWHDNDVCLHKLDDIMQNETIQPFYSLDSYHQLHQKLKDEREKYIQVFEERWRSFIQSGYMQAEK